MSEPKVIAMGENILDILFRDGQPVAAVPGGSSFNSIVSVGRAHVPCTFVGYIGADLVGQQTIQFMERNHVDATYLQVRSDEKSALSLAFLDAQGDANYVFYKEPPCAGQGQPLPDFCPGDVLLYGSYFAIADGTRPLVNAVLSRATQAGAFVYYDLNFRRSHQHELASLMPTIHDNFSQSTIVRGSADDFEVMFGTRNAQDIYEQHIRPHCPLFICTAGAGSVSVCTPLGSHEFSVPPVNDVVSTVGAGDNFNAGFSCALIWMGLTLDDLSRAGRDVWQQLVSTACRFAAEACRTTENYVSTEFGDAMASEAAALLK